MVLFYQFELPLLLVYLSVKAQGRRRASSSSQIIMSQVRSSRGTSHYQCCSVGYLHYTPQVVALFSTLWNQPLSMLYGDGGFMHQAALFIFESPRCVKTADNMYFTNGFF